MTIRRSGLGCREASGPPVNPTEPESPWGIPAAKVARVSRERARCGCTRFVWVADIGWTHRASSPPGGRKACWRYERALAGRKSVAPPDAGRGWVEGETVRVRTSSPQGSRVHVLRVSACRFWTRWKAFSGSCPPCFYRQDDAESLWLAGFHSATALRKGHRRRNSTSGGYRIPTRVCLRVTKRTSEVDVVW
jgi:hypothetical protein